MNLSKKFRFSYILIISIFLAGCSKDDDTTTPTVPNEEEVITTLIYTLSPDDGGDDVVFTFRDLDGDGGNAPVITNGQLKLNTNYTGALALLNESETPAEEITTEIQDEDDEHQFFFEITDAMINITYDDQDDDGNPVGLKTKLTTTDATQGQLKITLLHEPEKTASGVKDGDITNAKGETDIEVTFDISVE